MTTPSNNPPTPRTDAKLIIWKERKNFEEVETIEMVTSKFARQLETELIAANAELAELRKEKYLLQIGVALWDATFSKYKSWMANGNTDQSLIYVTRDYDACESGTKHLWAKESTAITAAMKKGPGDDPFQTCHENQF